jgi:hypothetical protein
MAKARSVHTDVSLDQFKRNTMLTAARNDQGQFLWNRSGSTKLPEPALCALLSDIDVSLDHFEENHANCSTQ